MLLYCMFIIFVLVDIEEIRGDVDACRVIYEFVFDVYEESVDEVIE